MSDWIVITPRVEGNPTTGYRTAYYTDRMRFRKRSDAIHHGAVTLGQADDFLLGEIAGHTLLGIYYMEADERRDDLNELRNAAADLGFGYKEQT